MPASRLPLRIRTAHAADAEAVSRVWQSSIRTLCSNHYTAGEIADWADDKTPERTAELIALEEVFLVAETAGLIVGFCCGTFALGTLALYVAPDCARRGVGGRLLRLMERLARDAGEKELRLHSARNAVGFYERQGYRAVETRQEVSGRRSVEMRKSLREFF